MELPVNYDSLKQKERRVVREEYVRIQEGLCQHCNQPLKGEPSQEIMEAYIHMPLFPKGFLRHPIHLHHDHNTGMTIGAVHARCNAHLWQYHGE